MKILKGNVEEEKRVTVLLIRNGSSSTVESTANSTTKKKTPGPTKVLTFVVINYRKFSSMEPQLLGKKDYGQPLKIKTTKVTG